MAYHENLRTIPLTGNVSESEEDGEIEKETTLKGAVSQVEMQDR